MDTMHTLKNVTKSNYVILLFLSLMLILSAFYPDQIIDYYKFVDWHTIIVLFGLMIITTAMKESHIFGKIAKRLIKKAGNEKTMALILISSSVFLSMFLINDIALFIVIPLTLSFQSYLKNNLNKLVIFEAISVNVGSMLTPIGNPQNLFLWHQWGVSFLGFTAKMFPVFAISFCVLTVFVLAAFEHKRLYIKSQKNKLIVSKKLFYLSLTFLFLFIVSVDLKLYYYSTFVIFIIYAVFFKDILKKMDWMLIILFIIMFIDFHIVGRIPFISDFIFRFNLSSSQTVFFLSLLSSQVISNVPASILMSKFTHNWPYIAYGVNIGGNGIVIGSLANIIALRFVNSKTIWLEFHKYSVPFLVVTSGIIYLLTYLT